MKLILDSGFNIFGFVYNLNPEKSVNIKLYIGPLEDGHIELETSFDNFEDLNSMLESINNIMPDMISIILEKHEHLIARELFFLWFENWDGELNEFINNALKFRQILKFV